MKTKGLIIISILPIIILGGVIYYGVQRGRSSRLDTSIASSGLSNDSATAAMTLHPTLDTSAISLSNQTSESQNDSGLKVENYSGMGQGQQVASTTPNSVPASDEKTAPGPETFSQYDQYKDSKTSLFGDIKVGTGGEATAGKKVAVSYSGWLTSGQLFDQSGSGKPFAFVLGSHTVIPGWEEGIAGLKVGGKRRLIVPPAAGYGTQGKGPIPPNAVLIFDVELVAVQ
ncbi:MAG: hypothetical protein NVSMB46_04510 [Candidatus Saccharimonadales bacterium]